MSDFELDWQQKESLYRALRLKQKAKKLKLSLALMAFVGLFFIPVNRPEIKEQEVSDEDVLEVEHKFNSYLKRDSYRETPVFRSASINFHEKHFQSLKQRINKMKKYTRS